MPQYEGMDTPPSTSDLVYAFLVRYKQDHDGNSPSIREIAEACKLVVSGVQIQLARLMMEGKIVIAEQGRSRSIEIVGAPWLPPEKVTNDEPERGGQEGDDGCSQESERKTRTRDFSRLARNAQYKTLN